MIKNIIIMGSTLGQLVDTLSQSSFYSDVAKVSDHPDVLSFEGNKDPLVLPPTDGKFFYSEIRVPGDGSSYAESKFDVLMGTEQQELSLWVSFQEDNLAFFSSDCSSDVCKSPSLYDNGASVTKVDMEYDLNEEFQYFDKLVDSIELVTCTGTTYADDMQFSYKDRNFTFTPRYWALDGATRIVETNYNGFIGLAPYLSKDWVEKEYNVLNELKKAKLMNHMVVSLFTNLETQYGSSVKFGSYDKNAIRSGNELTMLRTVSIDSWGVSLYSSTINGETVYFSDAAYDRIVYVDPQVPWLYIPPGDFADYASILQDIYSRTADGLKCDSRKCYFDKLCSDVDQSKFELDIRLFDVLGNTFDLNLRKESAFVEGDRIAHPNRCYMSFRSKFLREDDSWLLGNVVLQDYYQVFDATPHDERDLDFVQVGMAPQILSNLDDEYDRPESDEEKKAREEARPERYGVVTFFFLFLILVSVVGAAVWVWRQDIGHVEQIHDHKAHKKAKEAEKKQPLGIN